MRESFGVQRFRELFMFLHGGNIFLVQLRNLAELPVLQLEKR